MLNKQVSELLNVQINKEMYSAYLYLDMSNYYTEQGLEGFANWYMVQAQEEKDHALLFLKYMQNNGEKITFLAIDMPNKKFNAPIDPLKAGFEHEKYVTSLINAIYESAYNAKDFRTMEFLTWFVKEQGEEETKAENMVKKMELFGIDPKGLYMLDQEMAGRIYAAPSLVI